MDGTKFYPYSVPRAVLPGVSKEVNSLLNFIFDLQRFAGTTYTISKNGDNSLLIQNNGTTVATLTIDSTSKKYTFNGTFDDGTTLRSEDTLQVSSSGLDLGENTLEFNTGGTVNFTTNSEVKSSGSSVISVAKNTTLNISGSGTILNSTATNSTLSATNATVSLTGVTLTNSATASVTAKVVSINGGSFTMNGGTIKTSTTDSALTGGTGLYVSGGGTATMKDGAISGGSGVVMANGSTSTTNTFNQSGGTITTYASGGGTVAAEADGYYDRKGSGQRFFLSEDLDLDNRR